MRRFGLFVLGAMGLGAVSCDRAPSPPPPAPPRAEYVGGTACRPCHAEIASTYARTGMGRSWYRMTPAVVVEDFVRNNTIVVADSGLRYRMTERGGRYFMKQYLLDDSGAESLVDEREMVWVAGSGNHSRSYVTEAEGRLFQMPVCWYPSIAAWDLCPGFEMKNEYFGRAISTTCVFCHNGRMERVPGSRQRFATVAEGIDCERCHGPASLHVARWEGRTPWASGGTDPTIVNPRHLPTRERLHVCLQCHLGDSKATERVGRYDRPLESFRPGEPITSVMVPYRFRDATPGAFGISAQADRFLLSKCYTASGGKIECLTCHDPHVPVYGRKEGPGVYREKCLGCHAAGDCEGPRAARAATRPEDDCIACHMRRAEPDDHRHARFVDHWIRRTIDPPGAVARRSQELEPVFPEAYDALRPDERAFYDARAAQLLGADVAPAARDVLLTRSEARFRDAMALGFPRHDAAFQLGKVLMSRGKAGEAATAFAAAYAGAPADPDVALAHGQSLLRAGRAADAAKVFESIVGAMPDFAGPHAELARCRIADRQLAAALELYLRAVRAEPWNPILHANQAPLLSALGRHREAVDAALAAVRAAPEDGAMWGALAGVLAASGRKAEAEAAAVRARKLPPRRAAAGGMMAM